MLAVYRALPTSRRLAVTALLVAGLIGVLAGGGLLAASSYTAWEYASSDLGQRQGRQVGELEARVVWADGTPSPTTTKAGEQGDGAAGRRVEEQTDRTASTATLASDGAEGADALSEATPTAEPRAAARDLALGAAELRFDDPPEPGARARLVLGVRNESDAPSGPLSVAIDNGWFDGYRVVAAVPDVLDDRLGSSGERRFDFPGLAPRESAELELQVIATDEDLRAPHVRLELLVGGAIGEADPQTIAPRPRPGPARAISIPKLGLQSSVVPTAWEPPPFVVGQLRDSANLSQGNTVLIGHLTGLAGNVFARLDQLKPGDEVVAVSRGLEYRFIVSETLVLANDEAAPMAKTERPRLTLMTCTGAWNPFTQDYAQRLWVVAEPEELARETIKANAARATATARAPTATPTAEPTPEPTETPTAEPPARAAERATRSPERKPTLTATPRPRPPQAGLKIVSPSNESSVPSQLTVKGTRTRPVDPDLHAWMFLRPLLADGRWYVLPRELVAKKDGTWEVTFNLGGPPNVRHELRVGVVDAETQALLTRRLAERPDEPFDELPPGFWYETLVVVQRR